MSQATPEDLSQALEHWEELDEASFARLASHPESATKLAALRRIEQWMSKGGLMGPSVGGPFADTAETNPCPPAEDLFDFARSSSSNEAIEGHLEHCAECSGLIGSLAGRPPSPLILGTTQECAADEFASQEPRVGLRPLGPRSSWPPLLAAAGLAGLVLIPAIQGLSPWASEQAFPSHALLRGEDQALLFPRGKLLAAPQGAAVQYELPALQEAEAYRIEIFSHGPGAFEHGEQVANIRSENPLLSGSYLSPGLYRWRAFATVRGLESELGSAELQVVEQTELAEQLEAAISTRQPDAKLTLVHKLEAQGFESDARRLAQSLPQSPERDEYLRGPGR